MARNADRKPKVEAGSGNVYVDLGFPDAAERTTKTALAVEINRIVKTGGMSQVLAARLLGISQPKVSALAHYRLDGSYKLKFFWSLEQAEKRIAALEKLLRRLAPPATAAAAA